MEQLLTYTNINNMNLAPDSGGQYPFLSLNNKEQLPCAHGFEIYTQCAC